MRRFLNMQCLATFETTHMALRFEKTCRSAGYDVRIIPVPRRLSASCGLACSYPCDHKEEIHQLVQEEKIDVESTHELAD